MSQSCITPSCGKPSTMRCPKCLELGITTSYFCTQDCFKQSWKAHKYLHFALTSNALDDRFAGYIFTGSLRPAQKTPKRTLPKSIARPDYADSGTPTSERLAKSSSGIVTLNSDEIEKMRVTSKYAREVLDEAVKAVAVGVTTDEIDRIVHEACVERDCYPSPLNYYEFPKSCCTSINEVICHGIPDKRPLEDGDILNLDITTYHDGFHGDVNETIFVGRPDDRSIRLVKNAYDCLAKAMDFVQPGAKYRDVGLVISKQSQLDGFSVVRNYSGHGIHRLFHCPPNVPHYAHNKAVGIMRPGHCFTIEPMINEGVWADQTWPDYWTAVTRDGLRSAQFEHTMIILDGTKCASGDNVMRIEVVTKRQTVPDLDLANISDEDRRHFQDYGRPHFIDQLYNHDLLDRISCR